MVVNDVSDWEVNEAGEAPSYLFICNDFWYKILSHIPPFNIFYMFGVTDKCIKELIPCAFNFVIITIYV